MTYTNATTGCDHDADWRLARPGLPTAGNNPWICTGCEQPVHVDDNGRAVLGSPGTNATTLVEFLREQYRLDRDFAIVARLSSGRRAQLLADVESKRRILELHREDFGGCRSCAMGSGNGGSLEPTSFPCDTLMLLALPYAEHPNYNPSWRPAEATA